MNKKDGKNYCRRCRSEIPEGMAFCPHCMEKIEDDGGKILLESIYRPKVNKWFAVAVTAILCIILVMLGVVFFMLSKNNEKAESSFPESDSATEQTAAVQTSADTSSSVTEKQPLSTSSATSSAKQTTTVRTSAGTSTTTALTESLTEKTPAIQELPQADSDKEEQPFPESGSEEQETTVPITVDTDTTEVTEPLTEEMPEVQEVTQADFESIIKNGFNSWIGLGDAETLSFEGYSCTFSGVLMNEHINCTLVSADDFSSYVLTVSGNEYSIGSFVYGVEKHIRAFNEIILNYNPPFSGDNIRSAVRDMLRNNETSCSIIEENFSCDVEYNADIQTVTITSELN